MKNKLKHFERFCIIVAIIGLILDLLRKDWNCSILWLIIILQNIQLYKFETKQTPPNDVEEKPSKN